MVIIAVVVMAMAADMFIAAAVVDVVTMRLNSFLGCTIAPGR